MNIFWGFEDFVDIFLGSSQNLTSLRVISMQFRVFFKVNVQYPSFTYYRCILITGVFRFLQITIA